MFGKARTCNIVTVPEHEPSECNIVILGAMGSGKSGMIYIHLQGNIFVMFVITNTS